MTVGDKIKKYRLLRGMTRKELGCIVGFSDSTAAARINRYENNHVKPKADIRMQLASALHVNPLMLSDIDIRTPEEFVQVLYLLEGEFGIHVEETDDKVALSFSKDYPYNSKLIDYLSAWGKKQSEVFSRWPTGENDPDFFQKQLKEYELWQASFLTDSEQKEKEEG